MRIKFFRTKFSFRKSIKLILLLIYFIYFIYFTKLILLLLILLLSIREIFENLKENILFYFSKEKKTARVRSMKRFFMNVMFDAISINFWTFLNLVPLFLFRRLIAAWLIAHTVCLKSNFDVLFSSVLSLYDGGRPPLKFIKIFTAMKTISHARTFLINSIRLTAF